MIFFHFIADIPHGPFPDHGTIGQLENESLSHGLNVNGDLSYHPPEPFSQSALRHYSGDRVVFERR
jgi:hypothetical protein